MNPLRPLVAISGLAIGAASFAVPTIAAAHPTAARAALSGCQEPIQLRPPSEPQHELAAVQFVSSTTGWVVGGSRILATTDNGVHWRAQRRTHNGDYSAIDAINASDAWVVGRETVLRTTNGGRTWRALPDPCPRIDTVHFINRHHGFAIAGTSLLRTSDGGRHWHVMTAPRHAQSVCFFDGQSGWLGAHGQIYRTHNGGATWSRAVRGVHERHQPAGDHFNAEVQCAGASDGWAELIGGAAASQQAHVGYHLSDAGSRPVFSEGYFPYPGVGQLPASPGGYPGAFSALDAHSAVFIDNCVACGRGVATMDVATNDGNSLHQVGRVHHLTNLTGASFTSSIEGWGIGSVLHPYAHREVWRIMHTTDGGHTWRVQHQG